MEFVSFPSIESFFNVVKLTKSYPNLAQKPINYRGKIKLHGTNAGIRIHNGEVLAQSRTQIISPTNDNAGFARWVESSKDFWSKISYLDEITVFGEWCGPGIMKGTAINQVPNKLFAVFAIMVGNAEIEKEDFNPLIVEPEEIKSILGDLPNDVHILPWYDNGFSVDFINSDLQTLVDNLNKEVSIVEPEDPWVKSTFGISGTAEGIVYYPTIDGKVWRKLFSNFAFKAKGEQHKVTKTKEAVQLEPEVAKSIEDFVNLFVTDARVEQGISVCGLDVKNTGAFLKWFNADVKKESVSELEVSNLKWDDVQSAVQNKARLKFIEKTRKV